MISTTGSRRLGRAGERASVNVRAVPADRSHRVRRASRGLAVGGTVDGEPGLTGGWRLSREPGLSRGARRSDGDAGGLGAVPGGGRASGSPPGSWDDVGRHRYLEAARPASVPIRWSTGGYTVPGANGLAIPA